MNTITIDADQTAIVHEAFAADRPAVLIVEGICPLCIEAGSEHEYVGPCQDWLPPLWTDFDKPCDTCGGREVVNAEQMDGWCPDCRDGRTIIDFGEFRATVHVEPNDGRTWTVTLTEAK